MTTRIYPVQVVVPAGTLATAPVVQAVTLEDNLLQKLQVIIPDGHAGLTGLAVLSGGTNVFPFTQGAFLSGNDERIDVSQDAECTEAGFTAVAFNTDIYQHTFWLRFYVTDMTAASPVAIASPQASGAPAADVLGVVGQLTGMVA